MMHCICICFTVTAKTESADQHCEMPGCTDEVWAACNVGSCLTLLCYEHFDGTLSTAHQLTCKGRDRPDIDRSSTASPDPRTTAVPADDKKSKSSTELPTATSCSTSFSDIQVTFSDSEQSVMSSPQSTSTPAMSALSGQATDSADQLMGYSTVNMCAYESAFHPDVKLIPKQSIVSKSGKRVLSFQAGWFAEFPWLHYCTEVQGVLCFYCAKAEASKLSNLAKKRVHC